VKRIEFFNSKLLLRLVLRQEGSTIKGTADQRRTDNNFKMDSINEASINSVMNGGAANGLPNDGTGKLFYSLE